MKVKKRIGKYKIEVSETAKKQLAEFGDDAVKAINDAFSGSIEDVLAKSHKLTPKEVEELYREHPELAPKSTQRDN